MRFQSDDFEYRTARKDYKDCVLYAAECKVLSQEHNSILSKYIGIHIENNDDDLSRLNNMRCGVRFHVNFEHDSIFIDKSKQGINWRSHFFEKMNW